MVGKRSLLLKIAVRKRNEGTFVIIFETQMTFKLFSLINRPCYCDHGWEEVFAVDNNSQKKESGDLCHFLCNTNDFQAFFSN
jgi:hypothetical protein